MFLKILLGLAAVCFQVSCTRDNTRIYGKVPGDLTIGRVLTIEAWDSEIYPELKIRLYPYAAIYNDSDLDTNLNVEVSARTGILVIYSVKKGEWHNTYKYYWRHQNTTNNITVHILMEKDYFDIIANGKQYYLYHLKPVERKTAYDIKSSQILQGFNAKWRRQYAPCPNGLALTYVPK